LKSSANSESQILALDVSVVGVVVNNYTGMEVKL